MNRKIKQENKLPNMTLLVKNLGGRPAEDLVAEKRRRSASLTAPSSMVSPETMELGPIIPNKSSRRPIPPVWA